MLYNTVFTLFILEQYCCSSATNISKLDLHQVGCARISTDLPKIRSFHPLHVRNRARTWIGSWSPGKNHLIEKVVKWQHPSNVNRDFTRFYFTHRFALRPGSTNFFTTIHSVDFVRLELSTRH